MKTPRLSPVWLLCGAALALRAGWVIFRWTTRGPALDYPDEDLHWQLASNLVHHGTLVSDDGRFAARMPLYPLFLALFAGLGQSGILVARLVQAVLGAATVGVLYQWARAALGPRAALVAGLLVCCDPFGVFFGNLLLTEALFTLLASALSACAWAVFARPATARWSIIGVALLGPAALLTRPSATLWIPLIWLLIALFAANRRRTLVRLLLCPALLIVLLLPWGLRNRAVLGSFAWLSTNGGVTLYDAQGPQADGSGNQAFLADMPELLGLGEVERDRTLTRLALAEVRADPARVLRLAGAKFVRMWSLTPNVPEYRAGRAASVGAAYTLVLLGGAAAGLVHLLLMWRRNMGAELRRLHTVLWLAVVYFALLHCIYVGSVRYRVPLLPFLALAAATTLMRPITADASEPPT